MSYLVLARKWRPTRFDDVVGQRHVTQTLQNSIRRDRVPHALLFIGSRGIGKTSCARIFAKALNCLSESQPVPTPCEQCTSCLSVNQGNAVDVFEIDGASNNGVEQVRELRESTRFTPSVSRFKIYIIDEVHMLSVGAFNALLKTLEEPPPHVKFIFATTEPHKIPDTIISRCQRFDFKRINSKDIVDALEQICSAESIVAERSALEHVAREAQGGMRDSLSLLDQLISFCGHEITESKTREIFGLTSREMMLSLVASTLRQDASEVINLLSVHANSGADLKRLSAELLELLRDLMVIKVHPEPQRVLSIPPSELDQMILAANEMAVGAIHQVFQTLIRKADEIQRSAHPKLILEMTLLQMCHQADTATISEVMSGLLAFEQHLNHLGLNAGLPPLSPPPDFRPPPSLKGVSIPSGSVLNTQELGQSEGFKQAQPPATAAAPRSELTPSDQGRAFESELKDSNSLEQRTTSSSHTIAHLEGTVPDRPVPNSTRDVSASDVDVEQDHLAHSPPPPRSLSGLPKHPPLPADPEHTPLRGPGTNDLFYEWMTLFNRWLAQRDSFVASEMRIKVRYLSFEQEGDLFKLTWGAPEELLRTFHSQKEVVLEQLASCAHQLPTPLSSQPISPQQLELNLIPITSDSPEAALESLTECAKRKVAITASSQISQELKSEYVGRYLDHFGGQVVYVIPQALNR